MFRSRNFDPTELCVICPVDELLTAKEAEDVEPLIVGIAAGGMEEEYVRGHFDLTPAEAQAVIGCGHAIAVGLCLRYENINPGGGYDG